MTTQDIAPVRWCFTHREKAEERMAAWPFNPHSEDSGCDIGPACWCGEDIYRD